MAKKADVVVENFRPDVKRRLGIDYEHLARSTPSSSTPASPASARTGPYRDRPGVDQIAQGMGGLMSITGLPGQGPVRVGIPIADLTAGIFSRVGILVALLERSAPAGQWVATSLLQAQIFMLDFQAARWLMDGEVPKQAGNNHPTSIPTGVFKTSDGYINIATTGGRIWERFCTAIGRAGPRRTTRTTRPPRRARATATRSTRRSKVDGQAHQTPNGSSASTTPACRADRSTIDQVFADPQVEHLGMAQSVKRRAAR